MVYFPTILILPTNVYNLSFQKVESARALDRFLFDFTVQGVSFLDPHDKWTTLLGVSKEFWEDYIFYKLGVPIEWLLVRCLAHHLKANTLHLLSGDDGLVLNSSNFRTFLGNEASRTELDDALKNLLRSWANIHPKGVLEFKDLYVSTNITIDSLRRSVEELKSQGYIKDLGKNVYVVEKKTLQNTDETC